MKKVIRINESDLIGLIKNIIIEQDDNVEYEDFTPQEYIDLLKSVNYKAQAIPKFPDFRGKKIRVNGNLNLIGLKQITNLGELIVTGDLTVRSSGIVNFEGVTVGGSLSHWDTPYQKELDRRKEMALRDEARQRREIGNVEFSLEKYDSEFFEGLSEEQGTEGYFIIKETDLDELIKDEDAMKQLLDDDLSELNSELYNVHSNAYNGAYQSEIYGLIWSELDIHFVGRVIDEQTKIGETTKWLQYVKIRDLQGNVEKFLSNRLGSEYNEDKLDYEGSYTTMMKRLMDDGEYDWLDFRIPDYPDYGLVTKDINDIFGQYI